jgi:4-azaleucine resistance transporter AzlC
VICTWTWARKDLREFQSNVKEPMNDQQRAFWAGVRAELPLLMGVVPFGMIYGVLALNAGLAPAPAQMMSSIVFAGSAQFITAQLVRESVPGLVIVLTIAVVNLRHMLYSASVAPYLRALPMRWKLLLSYLLTDEAYAVTILNYEKVDAAPAGHWFFLGAGLTLWTSWQLSTAVGILLGTTLPESWPLDFALPITFIALIIPSLKDRPAIAASLTAGVVALLAYDLPYKLGLMIAGILGILVGTFLEGRRSQGAVSRSLPRSRSRGTRDGAGSQNGPDGGTP